MRLTLRYRILLTLLPLLALLAILGGAGYVLLSHLGGRIDVILRDNYDSVLYMERLGEALERIDSSFTFALAEEERRARKQYDANWKLYRYHLKKEQENITIPGEGALVERLTALTEAYRREGDAFYKLTTTPARKRAYFGPDGKSGLLARFTQIKEVANDILRMNQENMETASHEARATAASSLLWFGGGLVVAAALAAFIALRTVRAILRPIRAVTESALAIGAGNLDQVVPVVSADELGQLAGAFNTMARQLRGYRESQQARMLRLQQTNQAAIDAFPHPVLVVDRQGQVEMANPAARRLLGTAGNGEHAPLPWIPPEPLRAPLEEALGRQQDYLPEGFDHTLVLRVGDEERSFLPRVLTIREPHGQTLGAAVLLEDVTRFRLLDQVKSNLVATVSHELKTPLTGIRLAVHLLLEEGVGPLTAKQLELLLDARENTERLLAMIENLLDLARLEGRGGRLDLRPEAPEELLRQAAAAFRPRAEDKGVQLTVEASAGLPLVAADAGRLGRALDNLLDNALRYTGRGGRVALKASAQDGRVTLAVADTGPGIPTEYLPHVFDRFFRVPGQKEEGGTGLGLAIVREVATAHGGTATCESHLGKGTTFRLTLPACAG
jgi:two-component system, NtrC family, sensor histidine kinase KinB